MKRILNKVIYFAGNVLNPVKNEKGATAVEYALMVALIAVAIVLAVTAFGLSLSGRFGDSVTEIGIAFGSVGI